MVAGPVAEVVVQVLLAAAVAGGGGWEGQVATRQLRLYQSSLALLPLGAVFLMVKAVVPLGKDKPGDCPGPHTL